MTRESEQFKYRRCSIGRYIRSNKHFLLVNPWVRGERVILGDLDENLNLKSLRTVKYLKRSAIGILDLKADVLVSVKDGETTVKLLRLVTPEDTDIQRWKTTKNLEALPVLPHLHITDEENYWAGKVDGNIRSKILMCLIALLLTIYSTWLFKLKLWAYGSLFAFFDVLIIWFLVQSPWIISKPPEDAKIHQLLSYKATLLSKRIS